MSEAQMKKMKVAIDKVAKKRDRKMLRAAARRGARPTKNFQAAVAKAVVKQKGRDSGFVDHNGASTDGLTSAVTLPNEITAAGSINLIGTCTQGSSENQHPNKKFLLKSYQLRGRIAGQSTATINNVAFILVLDTEPTGATPAIADIFQAVPTGTFSGLPSVLQMLNPQNSARFRIIARRNYTLNGAAGDPNGMAMVEEYFDLKKIEVTTRGATSNVGDVQKNALFLVTLGTNPTGTTAVGAQLVGRMRFIDL